MGDPWAPTAHRIPTTVPRLAALSTPLRPRSSFWGRKFAGPKTSERADGSNPGDPADTRIGAPPQETTPKAAYIERGGLFRLG